LKFTCHILYRIDIAATKTNDRQTALVEINAALEELNQLEGESGGNLVIRTIIIVLSIISLSLVIIMIHYRHVGLVSMAGVTFKFFTEQVANNTNTPMPSNTYPNPLTAFPPVEGSFSIFS
jgi:hypothetical protein